MISRSQMNRQLYANGTGIAELLKMNQGAAQDELTEEQAFALMPEGVKEAFASMLEAGASPEEARRLISEQIAEMSRQSAKMSEQQMQRESQDIPEYYDRRLQILEPEQMREEMQNPSIPGYAGGGIVSLKKARDILEAEALPGESLAYINPQEAMMLKYMGGAGIPINSSGIPSYFVKSIVKSVGKVVKGATKAVKSIVSSDVGKIALLAAGAYYAPTLFGGTAGFGPASTYGSFARGLMSPNLIGPMTQAGSLGRTISSALIGGGGGGSMLSSLIPGKGTLLAAGAGLLGGAALGGALTPQQIETGMKRDPAAVRGYLTQYYKNINPEATESEAEQYALEQTREYAAEGGIIGRQNYGIGGMITKFINENPEIFKQLQMASPMRQYTGQYYGNLNPGKSVEEIEEYVRENAAYGGPMGELRTNQEGVKEIDYRQTGGFVPPIGIKEKADDVPAMLSNNEFVFTADAVRNAGGGDVNKGAQKMYTLMKTLENGGMA